MWPTNAAWILALALAVVFVVVLIVHIGKHLLKQIEQVGERIDTAASSILGSLEHAWDSHAYATHSTKKWIVKRIAIKYLARISSLFPQLCLNVSS